MSPPLGPWNPSYVSIWSHHKTFSLAEDLGIDETYAAAHVLRLSGWALMNAPDGDLSRLSDRAIAYGAGWRHEVGMFVRALVKAGFLDEDRMIHDWNDYGGKLIERRADDAERKRKARMSGGPAPDVRGTSNGTAAGIRRREEDTRGQETRGEESTVPTPQPPPPLRGEGARPRPGGDDDRKSRRPRGRTAQNAPAPPEVPADLTPPTEADRALWSEARDRLTDGWLPANAEKAAAFEPLGRDPSGWLWIRAPAWAASVASQPQLAACLVNAGDPFGQGCVLVEGS